jgi:hypothetical protein
MTADDFSILYSLKSGKKTFYCFNKKIIGSELRHYVQDNSTTKFAFSVPGPNPRTKSRRFGPRVKNQIRRPNFVDQMWHKFPGLRMKNEAIFSNDDQISGYDSKKTVCSTFGLQGCGCSKALKN